MRTVISNMIRITDPVYELKQYAIDNLELANPEYEKKLRMGFWTGRTPKKLRLYEWDGNTLVLPFGTMKDVWPMIRTGEWELDFRQDEVIDYGECLPLYDYQDEAVAKMIAAKFGILKSAAGSGKTQCGIALIQAFRKRALWLCAKHDLLKQSYDRAKQYVDESLLGTITEGEVHMGKGITFATVQTMCKVDLDRYRHEWDVVIVDECHNVAASATTMTRYQKVLNNLAARHIYGLTATPARADGLIKATFALIGPVQYEVPEEAVADKIMKVTVRPVETQTKITDDCLNVDGTLNYTKLIEHLTTDEERNKQIVRCVMDEKEHSCLILSNRLKQLETLRNLLPYEMQEKSAMISGKMTSKKDKALREEIMEKMRSGELKYLFASYSISREGLDIPRLDRLFMATPEKFSSVIIQSVGRIARTFTGKGQPIAYDFVDNEIGFCKRAYKERCRHYRATCAEIEQGFLSSIFFKNHNHSE